MPKKVKVAFSPPNQTTWTFDANPATISKHGSIEMKRDPQSPVWSFVSANGLDPLAYEWSIDAGGKTLTIQALGEPPYNTPIKYSVTVKSGSVNGGPWESPPKSVAMVAVGPPPIIVNDGTLPIVRTRKKLKKSSAKTSSAKTSSAKTSSAKTSSAKTSSAKTSSAKKSSAKKR